MILIVGPVVRRGDVYVFDTWTPEAGLRSGFPYGRIEDACYARKAMLRDEGSATGLSVIACATLDAVEAEIAAIHQVARIVLARCSGIDPGRRFGAVVGGMHPIIASNPQSN